MRAAVVVVALAALVAACGRSDGPDGGTPAATPTMAATSEPSPTDPTPTTPAEAKPPPAAEPDAAAAPQPAAGPDTAAEADDVAEIEPAADPGAAAELGTVAELGPEAEVEAVAGSEGAVGGDDVAELGPADYSGRGPYPVGVAVRLLAGRAVPDRVVYIYYPAAPSSSDGAAPWTYSSLDAFDEAFRPLIPEVLTTDFAFDSAYAEPDPAAGPFPTVMFSHGAGGYPADYSELTIRMASWGFVVVAPDHYERDRMASTPLRSAERIEDGDVDDLFAAAEMLHAEAAADGPLGSLADPAGPLVAVGQSAGGRAARRAALRGGVAAWVGWAPVINAQSDAPDVPGLLVAADDDIAIAAEDVRGFAASARSPVALLVLDNAGHNSFTDSCPAVRERGGLLQYADELGVDRRLLELGEDGCLPDDTDATEFWPLIAHATIAHIRTQLGLDDGSSLDPPWLQDRFGRLIETYLPPRR